MARRVWLPSALEEGTGYREEGASQAVLFAPGLRSTPVMHDRGSGDLWDRTRCGAAVFDPATCLILGSVVLLRVDQAYLFCRPCRRCWP